MTRSKAEQLRAREAKLIAQITATNRERAALAATTGPAETSRGKQARLTRKLVTLREQLAQVHEEMKTL